MRVTLYVSGASKGYKNVTVRSTDGDADGRVTSMDGGYACDLDYNGSVDLSDLALVQAELNDWHRHVLFGTPLQRTSNSGEYGDGHMGWEPNGDRICFTFHSGPYCHVW